MGKPITKIYNGQETKLCCKPCIKKSEANQAKHLSKLPKQIRVASLAVQPAQEAYTHVQDAFSQPRELSYHSHGFAESWGGR